MESKVSIQSVTPAAWTQALLKRETMLLILMLLCVALSLAKPVFYSPANLLNVLRLVSILGVIAFGMTMVIIVGEIDLSVGSLAALVGCVAAVVLRVLAARGWGSVPAGCVAMLLVLLVGGASGLLIALLRNRWLVPSFITSLALFTALRGAALLLTGGYPETTLPAWFKFLGNGSIGSVPVPVVLMAIVFGLTHFLMNHTVFGRMVYAVGSNAEAARLSGVPVGTVRAVVLAMTGVLAALGGVMLAGKIGSATPTIGEGMELEVITAVIIGGTSFSGGAGRVWGTFVGLLFAGVIVNGMTLLNMPIDTQYVVRGVLILVAVLINQVFREGGTDRG